MGERYSYIKKKLFHFKASDIHYETVSSIIDTGVLNLERWTVSELRCRESLEVLRENENLIFNRSFLILLCRNLCWRSILILHQVIILNEGIKKNAWNTFSINLMCIEYGCSKILKLYFFDDLLCGSIDSYTLLLIYYLFSPAKSSS